MNNVIYAQNEKIRYSELDYNLVLKPSALLQFLQDLASDNAEQLGFGYSFISKNNLGWFLLKYHIEFSDYPHNLYEIKVTTEPRGYNKLFAFRDFEIFNGQNLIARASSTWSLVDIDTKSIVPVEQVLKDCPYMNNFEKRESDLQYRKIKPLSRVDLEKTYEIRFDDLDVNRHVNNVNYIIWAFETLDFDYRSSKRLKTLDILYKKEIKFGSLVLSQAEVNDNTTSHILKDANTNEDLCFVLADWC